MFQADTGSPAAGSSHAEAATDGFRADIEGLRAVAVVAVVLFHAGVPGVGGGFVGVDVFFVISGFLITGLLWRETRASGTISLRRFYAARARRLLPASATVGIVTMVAAAVLLSPMQIKNAAVDGITSALYVCNYWFIAQGVNYFGNQNVLLPSPFQHYWSLAVEEQFYFIWPLMIIGTTWALRRFRRRARALDRGVSERPYAMLLGLIAATSFAVSLVVTYVIPPAAYFSLPTRAWQLAVGGLVALTVPRWRGLPARPAAITGWTGLTLIGLACNRLSEATVYPGLAAALPTLGAAMVIGAGCAGATRGCGRFLGLASMGAIGRLSYSLYLWHWPVLVLVPVMVGETLGLPGRLALVLLSVGLAALTLRFVENPFRFSPVFRTSARASLSLGGAATAAAVCVGVILLLWVPTPTGRGPAARPLTVTAIAVPPESSAAAYDEAVQTVFEQIQAGIAASADRESVPSNLSPPLTGQTAQFKTIMADGCLRLPTQRDQPECVAGDPDSTTTVAVIGDSRAAMFKPSFQLAAQRRQWRLELMAKAACPIVDLPVTERFNVLSEAFQGCSQWRSHVMDRLIRERPDLIVISSARAYSERGIGIWGPPGFDLFSPAWINGLSRLAERLRDNGSKVLLLGPTPDANASVPDCLAAHIDSATSCTASRAALDPKGMSAEAAAVEVHGGRYADMTELFCAADRCPVIVGNIMVYFDAGHITSDYARLLAPALEALADRALAQT